MTSRRRAMALSATVLLCAAALLLWVLRPPARARLHPPSWQPRSVVIAGAFHVHTNRSDGSGSLDDVAAAAARAGLGFVVTTDHGDGTRPPEAPAYRSGVLTIDGVEISTEDGHYAVADMPASARAIIGRGTVVTSDVARRGGFGIVAHGDSPKSEQEWRAWGAPIDGVEWINLDSVWRAAPAAHLARASVTYWLRKPEALASLMKRPSMLDRFDELSATRRVINIGATDAHGPVPAYESCFRTLATRVELDAPLSGDPSDAGADAKAILAALRAGHHYTAIDALATPAVFEFVGRAEEEWQQTGRTARQGDVLPTGRRITLEARVAAPPGAVMVLLQNGRVLRETRAETLIYGVGGEPAAYRVEVRLPGAPGEPPVPWIVSNAIFVGNDYVPPRDRTSDR